MGFLDDVKRVLRREAADAEEWVADSVAGGNRHLDQAERDLAATPDERLQATLDDIAASEDAFAAVRAKADAASARPLADAELAEADGDATGDALPDGPLIGPDAPPDEHQPT